MELLGKQTGAGRPQPVGTAQTDPAIILLIQELKAQTLTLLLHGRSRSDTPQSIDQPRSTTALTEH